MSKLPKEIYVDEESEVPNYYTDPKEHAVTGETRILGVYKLVGKVEVSTQIKQEIVVKKSPAAKKVHKNLNQVKEKYFTEDPEEQTRTEGNALLQEMRVTTE